MGGQASMAKLRAPEDVWRRVRLAPGTEARTRPHAIVLPRERQPCTICLVYTPPGSWSVICRTARVAHIAYAVPSVVRLIHRDSTVECGQRTQKSSTAAWRGDHRCWRPGSMGLQPGHA